MFNIDSMPLSYGMTSNELFNNRFKRISDIKNMINSDSVDSSVIKIISECDTTEYPNLIDSVSEVFEKDDITNKKFLSVMNIIKFISEIIMDKDIYSNEIMISINKLIENIIETHKNLQLTDSNEFVNSSVNDIISRLKTIVNNCTGVNEKGKKIDYGIINEIKNSTMTESIILSTTSEKIFSPSNPNGTNIVGHNISLTNPVDLLQDILNAENIEVCINRLDNLVKYFDKYKLNLTDIDIPKLENVISHSYDRLLLNNTGLYKLRTVLEDLYNRVSDTSVLDFDCHNKLTEFKGFICKQINEIKLRIKENENKSLDYETDIMTEFGFGFVYEYPENMTLTEAESFTEKLNSMDTTLSESIIALNEFFNSWNSNRERQREIKMEKQEQKRIQRSRDIDTIKYNGRVLTLTNSTARQSLNSIKRLISGVAVGGAVALAAPQMAVLAGALTVISAFAKSGAPLAQRRRLLIDLKSELKIIDEKINECDRVGDIKNRAKLMRMKGKMEETYNRVSYNVFAGDVTL